MSLIQEALRRQQQEYGGGTTQDTPSSVSVEPPVTEAMPVLPKPADTVQTPPVPPTPPATPPPVPMALKLKSKPVARIGGIAAVAVIVLVGGLIAAKWIFKARAVRQSAVAAQAVPQPPPPPAAAAPAASAPAVTPPALPAAPPAEAAPAPPPAAAPAPEPAAKAPAGTAKQPPAPAAKLQWPALKLSGILAGPGVDASAARINNQMVYAGGQISGVTLLEIRADGVLLKYGDETKFLKMGGVMY